MKVVYVTTEVRGGMAHYVQGLASAMRRFAGCRVGVFVEPQDRLGGWDGLETIRLPVSSGHLRHRILEKYNPLYYQRLARLIADTAPDVVHLTSTPTGLLSFVRALHRRGINVVYTIHDPLSHDERLSAWGRVYRAYQRRYQIRSAMAVVNAIHVHSFDHAQQLCGAFGQSVEGKVYVVHHGTGVTTAISQGKARPRELDRVKKALPTLLFFGRIERYKGLDILIDAVRRLDDDGLAVNLIIAGAGTIDEQYCFRGGTNIILINRFIEDVEIREIFTVSDLVVLPYRNASQSGIVHLAYALSRPVLATQVGSLPEVVIHGQTGALVQPENPKDLADMLKSLIADRRSLIRMGQRGADFGAECLSWSAAAEAHLSCYLALR